MAVRVHGDEPAASPPAGVDAGEPGPDDVAVLAERGQVGGEGVSELVSKIRTGGTRGPAGCSCSSWRSGRAGPAGARGPAARRPAGRAGRARGLPRPPPRRPRSGWPTAATGSLAGPARDPRSALSPPSTTGAGASTPSPFAPAPGSPPGAPPPGSSGATGSSSVLIRTAASINPYLISTG